MSDNTNTQMAAMSERIARLESLVQIVAENLKASAVSDYAAVIEAIDMLETTGSESA